MWRENQMKIGIGPVENLRMQGKVREAEGKRHGWNVSIRIWNLKACVKVLLRIKKHGGVDCWDQSDLALGWKKQTLNDDDDDDDDDDDIYIQGAPKKWPPLSKI